MVRVRDRGRVKSDLEPVARCSPNGGIFQVETSSTETEADPRPLTLAPNLDPDQP